MGSQPGKTFMYLNTKLDFRYNALFFLESSSVVESNVNVGFMEPPFVWAL